MSQAELGAARQARQAATKGMLSGIGSVVGGVGTLGAMSGDKGWFGKDIKDYLLNAQ
jgi:hypothetical protein